MFEDTAGVGHGLIEHETVEIIAEVVVGRDIAGAAAAAVAMQGVKQLAQWVTQARYASLQSAERIAIDHQNTHQRRQIVATPVTVDIGLTRTDAAGEHHIGIELRTRNAHRRAQSGLSALMAEPIIPIGVDQAQLTVLQTR